MKPRLDYVELYITNVCNYSCTHCQSLNNFAFKGHQRWNDYKDQYTVLSNQVDFTRIQIIGGEPTLNPDFEKWVLGISSLWPNSKLEISSNGSGLDKITDLIYKTLSKHNGTLWLTCHDIEIYDALLKFSKDFLDEIVSDHNPDTDGQDNWEVSYNTIRDTSWPDCNNIDQFFNLPEDIKKEFTKRYQNNTELHPRTVARLMIDKNGVEVKLDWSQSFFSSAVEIIDRHKLKMKFNSDPIQAHEKCYFKNCHQLNKGKLYKCPLVSVLPDFLNQFNVDTNNNDLELANSYAPATSLDDTATISKFIKDINQPIPQCKFCPTSNNKYNFVGTDKKIKIISV